VELDFDDFVARGLLRYVHLVSEAVGLRGVCSFVQQDGPLSAYVALDGRLRGFPDHDVALLWEETRGWSAALETHSGADLLVVAHLGRGLLPPPGIVAAWTRRLFRRDLAGLAVEQPVPAPDDTLRQRLAAYLGRDADVAPAPHADPPLAPAG
jgi:uncharacterized protein DUF6292